MKVLAPGKLVAWGEYAVLAGAPAVVMALDRYAEVSLNAETRPLWRMTASGFKTPGVHLSEAQFCRAPVAAFTEAILQHWGYDALPSPFAMHTNSERFFLHNQKIGIGSSAAVCTATYYALCDMLKHTPDLQEVSAIHKAWQGGKGSGLDIAASWHGGVIRFDRSSVSTWQWPQELAFCVVFTGSSAATTAHLGQFSSWRAQADQTPLDALCDASVQLTEHFELTRLAHYISCLAALDQAAKLNIFTDAHQQLSDIASQADVLYKPCGAGGGDIGIALSYDAAALSRFASAAEQQHYQLVTTEIAAHGVTVERP